MLTSGGYGQEADGIHPTGMLSCIIMILYDMTTSSHWSVIRTLTETNVPVSVLLSVCVKYCEYITNCNDHA